MKKKPKLNEIATTEKDVDIFAGYLKRLENPDPVLRTESGGKGLQLYDEVARDPHAASVLQTRYLAVVGKEWQIEPATDSAEDQKIADFVAEVLRGCNHDQARQELLQAILYGYYACEVMWDYSEGQIGIKKLLAKHPRRFIFTTDRKLRLLTPQNMIDGEIVPDRKFLTFTYGSSDNPYGVGLGQKLWWPIWFKKHGIKFWVIFAEKFGSPTAIGKYPAGTKQTDQEKLLETLEAIQQEAGIIIPENMLVELLEIKRSNSQDVYKDLCEFMNADLSKVVLGQTLTTEVGETGGAYAASKTHDDVRQEIVKADSDLLCECQNETLIRWIVDYNYPAVKKYPKIWIRTEQEKDLKPLAERDKIIVREIGLPVAEEYFYDTYNIPKPEKKQNLVSPPQSQPPPEEIEASEFAEKKTFHPHGGNPAEVAQGQVDGAVEKAVLDAIPFLEKLNQAIAGVIQSAVSYDEAKALLTMPGVELLGDFAGHVADAMLKTNRIGSDSVLEEVRQNEPIEMADAKDTAIGIAVTARGSALWGPGLPFREAVEWFQERAFTIAGFTQESLLENVKQEILRNMEKGETFRDFKKNFKKILGKKGITRLKPYRIETIYRTNMQSAYQAGRYQQMQSATVKRLRPYWRYVAVMDNVTRPEHAAMNGKVYPADHEIWGKWYPPNGFNCRCYVETVSARELQRYGWQIEENPVLGIEPDKGFEKLPLAA